MEIRPSYSTSSSSGSIRTTATTRSSSSSHSSNSSNYSNSSSIKAENLYDPAAHDHSYLPRHLQDPLTREYPLENPNQPINFEECLRRKPLAHTFGAALESRGRELERAKLEKVGKEDDPGERHEKERRLKEERRKDLEKAKAQLREDVKWH